MTSQIPRVLTVSVSFSCYVYLAVGDNRPDVGSESQTWVYWPQLTGFPSGVAFILNSVGSGVRVSEDRAVLKKLRVS